MIASVQSVREDAPGFYMTVLELKAQHDALQKIASTRDPVKALAEFVWNALDADAKDVNVELERNVLGGLNAITIRDDGEGISREHALSDFENLGASWKRLKGRTSLNRVLHGKEGQGRLRFFSIAGQARWWSVSARGGTLHKIRIDIDAQSLHKSSVIDVDLKPAELKTGTLVELISLKDTFDWLTGEEARNDFTAIFAPYVLQYPDVAIRFDGHTIDPLAAISHSREWPPQTVKCPTCTVDDLRIRVIEWKHSEGGRKIHMGAQNGVVLGAIPANVAAPGFDFSVYAFAPFFQEIADANLLETDNLTDVNFAKVVETIRDQVGDYFRERQADQSGELIDELIKAGVYPYEGDPASEVERRERQVLDIAIHAVTSYSRDFKKAENPLKKMTLRLLREAIRHNPEAIHNILHHVFNLPKNKQDEFSSLLQRTKLGNIISASTMIADRIVVLEVLKGIVFNPTHRRTVKERGELDVLIQANTWIFGESFHITVAESGLNRIMQRVSDELGSNRKSRKVTKPDGRAGRVDSFLGRLVPHQDQMKREFLLIELKRPALKISRKELDQLEDYVNAIRVQPDFVHTSTFWNFFIVTGEYDEAVRERISQKDRPVGVLLERPTHVVWVKTWSELIRECEARLHFVTEKLQIEVSAEEIETRIESLKTSILKQESKRSPPRTNAPTEGVETSPV